MILLIGAFGIIMGVSENLSTSHVVSKTEFYLARNHIILLFVGWVESFEKTKKIDYAWRDPTIGYLDATNIIPGWVFYSLFISRSCTKISHVHTRAYT